jgi:hypothetical protein
MKRLLLVSLAAAVVGAALYATTAPAGQQAVTPAQFNALKKRVTADEKKIKDIEGALAACLNGAVPAARYTGYVGVDSQNTPFVTTAIDVVDQGDQPTMYLLDVGAACAQAIGGKFHILRVETTRR